MRSKYYENAENDCEMTQNSGSYKKGAWIETCFILIIVLYSVM